MSVRENKLAVRRQIRNVAGANFRSIFDISIVITLSFFIQFIQTKSLLVLSNYHFNKVPNGSLCNFVTLHHQ